MLEQKIRERRMTLEEFAEFAETFARERGEPGTLGLRHLHRLVAGRKSSGEPLGPVRQVTARLLESIFETGIEELLSAPSAVEAVGLEVSAEPPGRADLEIAAALEWLDERAGWAAGMSRAKVRARVRESDPGALLDQRAWRAKVGRRQLVRALDRYYDASASGHGMYRVRYGDEEVVTTVFGRPDWWDGVAALDGQSDRLVFNTEAFMPRGVLSARGVEAAVYRIAESAALGVRVANLPLYRLLNVQVGEVLTGTVGLAPFIEYALTVDLLEREMVDAVSRRHGGLPLRDEYLPDVGAVLDPAGRVCAGGVVALCAIARPRDRFRGEPDFALLVQERSGSVLNAAGRLAVIPKGFHQPLNDVRADVQLGATLLRELEEELFGRTEVDTTSGECRAAAPMHPARWSEPMRWLAEEPGRLRLERTGFGFNLVSGNYEFASLVVIEDEEFWPRFGGQVEANWEAVGLQLYSSLDGGLIGDLIARESWSNEGLFALLQGLRRLREIGGKRVDLPEVELSGL
ncbi:transcriptional regulator [Saccharothrix obliqua]|uniref:transcriptional regulator n=1 Tax=Saccharothrix obliqua TaxID=2861747 RepID=UPI0027E3532A|nr:transcriptional regulator [Saccharothrix obliqua]